MKIPVLKLRLLLLYRFVYKAQKEDMYLKMRRCFTPLRFLRFLRSVHLRTRSRGLAKIATHWFSGSYVFDMQVCGIWGQFCAKGPCMCKKMRTFALSNDNKPATRTKSRLIKLFENIEMRVKGKHKIYKLGKIHAGKPVQIDQNFLDCVWLRQRVWIRQKV